MEEIKRMFNWIKSVLVVSLLSIGLSLPSYADEREDIIRTLARVAPSVGALYGVQEGGDMRFLCTATAVDRKDGQTVILSAHHCLDKGVSYFINFGDNLMRPLTAWKAPHYEVDKEKLPRKYNEPETDMAFFLMDGADVPIVPLAEHSRLNPGTKVLTIGFPLGVTKINYEGTVAGFFNRVGSARHGYMMLQIFGAPGSSGSAVISINGEVVSVLVSAKQAPVGLPVIFATPIEYKENLVPIRNE